MHIVNRNYEVTWLALRTINLKKSAVGGINVQYFLIKLTHYNLYIQSDHQHNIKPASALHEDTVGYANSYLKTAELMKQD